MDFEKLLRCYVANVIESDRVTANPDRIGFSFSGLDDDEIRYLRGLYRVLLDKRSLL